NRLPRRTRHLARKLADELLEAGLVLDFEPLEGQRSDGLFVKMLLRLPRGVAGDPITLRELFDRLAPLLLFDRARIVEHSGWRQRVAEEIGVEEIGLPAFGARHREVRG